MPTPRFSIRRRPEERRQQPGLKKDPTANNSSACKKQPAVVYRIAVLARLVGKRRPDSSGTHSADGNRFPRGCQSNPVADPTKSEKRCPASRICRTPDADSQHGTFRAFRAYRPVAGPSGRRNPRDRDAAGAIFRLSWGFFMGAEGGAKPYGTRARHSGASARKKSSSLRPTSTSEDFRPKPDRPKAAAAPVRARRSKWPLDC